MRRTLGVMVVCGLALAVGVAAAPPKAFKVEVQAAGSVLAVSVPVRGAVRAYLVVAGPNDFRVERAFTGNEPIAVNLGQLKDAQGEPVAFTDGDYKWELRLNTPSPEGAVAAPAVQVPESSALAGPKVDTWVASGRFKVQGGGIIPIVDDSKGKTPTSPSVASSGGTQAMAIGGSGAGAEGIVVHPMTTNPGGNFFSGNLYSSGGACAGCTDGDLSLFNGELLVKDFAPWVTLRDTDDDQRWRFWSGSGPLYLSSARLGGTGQTTPLTVEKDTPDNTLYVDSTGRVGIGTSTPAGALHLMNQTGDPKVILDNGSGAFNHLPYQAYVNSSGYFGLGTQASGNCALCITPTAQVSATLYIDGGKVGIGTSAPYYNFDVPNGFMRVGGGVYVGANAGLYTLDFLGNTGADRNVFRAGISGYSNGFTVRYLNGSPQMVYSFINGNVGIGVVSPAYPLQVGGAYCTVGGVWTNASSREYKQDIRELSTEAAEDALEKLSPVTYTYKAAPEEHHVGFIAEDSPDLVATADHKGMSAMDVVAVLTRVVQDQKTLLEEQRKAIAELKQEVAELKQRR